MGIINLILILLLVCIVPTAIYMEPSFFWENGPVEMMQNIVLALGTVWSGYWTYTEKENRSLWFMGAWLFLIALLRELSWGRVFFVKGYDPDGPIIAEKADLWFGPYIDPFVACLLLVLIVSIILNRKTLAHLGKTFIKDKTSWIYALLLLLLLAVSQMIFDRNAIKDLSLWHQGFEEMCELTSYWASLALAVRLHYLKTTNKRTIK